MPGELSARLLGQYQKDLDMVSRQLFELGMAAFEMRIVLKTPEVDEAVRVACLAEMEQALARLPREFVRAYEERGGGGGGAGG